MVYISRSPLADTIYADRVRDALTALLVFVFIFNVVFLPADNFGLKKLSFLLILAFNADRLMELDTPGEKFAGIFGFGLTTYCIFKSILLNGDIMGNISYGFAGYILLLYIIIEKSRIPFVQIAMGMLAGLAIIIAVSGVLDVLGIYSVYSNTLLMWMYFHSNALVGSNPVLPIGITIFLFASPLLLIAIPWFISRHRWILAGASVIGVVLSGTRANIMMGLTVAFVGLVLNSRKPYIKYLLCIAGAFFAVYVFVRFNIIGAVSRMFEKKVESDNIRSMELDSLLQVWRDNPLKLITGQGFSTTFFNAATQSNDVSVEWSYVNLLRQVGLIPFIAMMVMYLTPAIKSLLSRHNVIMAFGYLGYLAVAATNPLLYTSTGMTALLLMMCLSFEAEPEEFRKAIKWEK